MKNQLGFTLIELLVTIVIVAILTAIAMPAYNYFIIESRAKNASADLVALSLDFSQTYSKTLSYPVYSAGTAATTTLFTGWSPTATDYFSYTVSSTSTTYTLTATGTGSLDGCVLTLDSANTRTATDACGFTSW